MLWGSAAVAVMVRHLKHEVGSEMPPRAQVEVRRAVCLRGPQGSGPHGVTGQWAPGGRRAVRRNGLG